MSKFFINRPIVAMVIAILTVFIGAITIARLPVAQFPDIVPPEAKISATFVGANAQTLAQSVATPIEEQMSGVDNMNYMYSVNATANGQTTMIVDFGRGYQSQYGSHSDPDARNSGVTSASIQRCAIWRNGAEVDLRSADAGGALFAQGHL